jgi:pyrroline-5-carboxylate reductase
MKLGIIGCGNMCKAIAGAAIHSKVIRQENLFIKNSTKESTKAAAESLNAYSCTSIQELLEHSDTVILGVKPYTMSTVLKEISECGADTSKMVFISIAAGIKLASLEAGLPEGSKIIRTMPNTPTLVNEGMIAYTMNSFCDNGDEAKLFHLLEGSATLRKVAEHLIDVVTGLSGSGPAFVFMFIESLADGALKLGMPKQQALEFAAKTVLGSAKMLLETALHPSVLRDKVTSPGGTTIAGIAALEENGFRNAVMKAVQAATQRAKELE